jgi:hypothetical protein
VVGSIVNIDTGGGKSFDRGTLSHNYPPQKTNECLVLATLIQDTGVATLCQNRLQAMDMGG